jgi:hypothetical protein
MCRHRAIHPDDQRRDRYETAFKKWRELYDVLDTLSV